MKKFDLAKALAGEPISFKGYKTYLHCSKKEEHSFIVESAVSNMVWSPVHLEELTECTMWQEPRPTVTLTLPCPLKEPQEEMWFINNVFEVKKSYYGSKSEMLQSDKICFERGLYFASEEDAQAWLDAMKNSRR